MQSDFTRGIHEGEVYNTEIGKPHAPTQAAEKTAAWGPATMDRHLAIKPQINRQSQAPSSPEAALEAALADTLPRVFLLAFFLYAVIAIVQSLTGPELWRTPLPLINVATALFLLVCGLAMKGRAVPTSWAHRVFAAAAFLVLVNCLLRIYLTATPVLSVVFFLIGVACLVRLTFWFLVLEGIALSSAVLVAVWVLPAETWPGFIGLHVIGFGNAVLIFFVRARADRKTLTLQVQLQQQNDILEEAVATARKAERRYQVTLDNASDVIFTMDPAGRPTYLNPVAERIFPPSSWGDGIFFLNQVHPDYRRQVEHQLHQQLEEGRPTISQELRLVDENGQERWLEQIVRLVGGEGQRAGLHVVARDLSTRKSAEQALLMREKILGAVAEVANLMIGEGEFHAVLGRALLLLGEAAQVSRVYAFQNSTDESGRTFTSEIAEWCEAGIETSGQDPRLQDLSLADLGIDVQALLSTIGGLFSPTDQLPQPLRGLVESRRILSLAIVPIYVDSELWGFIGFDDCVKRRCWSPGEVDTLHSAARIIGGALARRAMERELRLARDTAEAATRTKSEFLANMSHEIRTPLNGILGMADLVLQGELEAAQRERITSVINSGKALLTIINDILDLSRIEAGRIELDSVPFRPGEVIADVVQLLRPSADGKGLRFQARIAESVDDLALVGDPVKLRQILTNVLGNAVKFTDRGQVTVEVLCKVAPEGQAVLHITVSDTGIGIESKKLERVFEPFEQGDSSVTRRFGGTGLGLAITRSLVERMGGSMDLDSEAGRGTEITLALPFAVTTREEREELTGAAPKAPELQGADPPRGEAVLRALLAEDDDVSRHIASAFLEATGCHVDQARDGREAVEMANRSRYDVIFMDIQMPKLDGLSATRAIRAGSKNSETPIIAMTALAMDGDRERCLAAGMSDYLSKPLDRQKVALVLKTYAWSSSQESGVLASETALTTDP